MLKVFIKRFFILALFFSSGAFSADTYWLSSTIGDTRFSSLDSLCAAMPEPSGLMIRQVTLSSDGKSGYCYKNQYGTLGGFAYRVEVTCPAGTVYDSNISECVPPEEPEPDQCQAGKETSVFKFVPDSTVVSYPPKACLLGCTFVHTSSTPCWWPHTNGEVVGSNCKITYTGTGEECGGGDDPDSPPDLPPDSEEPPDGPPNPDCKRFVNADGSWGYNCNPKPDPDENNNCPPGYMIQGDTCFRIPPDHPDYDKDKDPEKPGEGDDGKDPDGTGGTGGLEGVAQEKTLQDINKSVKDIDASIKSGTASTNALLQGIKDAIGNIPGGGGGGPRPGTGDGEGEGEGDGPELTAPDSGSFDEAIEEQDLEIEDLKMSIQQRFESFKSYKISGLSLSESGGKLPVFSFSTKHFGSHQVDLNAYSQQLSAISNGFVFVCGVFSVILIFVRV